eukprot:Skav221786  [mRNA]  locus=scaffold4067:66441:68282:- [translate_table: standard]
MMQNWDAAKHLKNLGKFNDRTANVMKMLSTVLGKEGTIDFVNEARGFVKAGSKAKCVKPINPQMTASLIDFVETELSVKDVTYEPYEPSLVPAIFLQGAGMSKECFLALWLFSGAPGRAGTPLNEYLSKGKPEAEDEPTPEAPNPPEPGLPEEAPVGDSDEEPPEPATKKARKGRESEKPIKAPEIGLSTPSSTPRGKMSNAPAPSQGTGIANVLYNAFFPKPGKVAAEVGSKRQAPAEKQREVKLGKDPEPEARPKGSGTASGSKQPEKQREASPAPSNSAAASVMSVDATLGIGLSAYFTGPRESMSRLLTRIQAAVGTMNVSTEGLSLDGFPSRGELKRLIKDMLASESRDTLPDDARRTLEAVEFFFQEKERIYNESLDRRKEKEANAKFSQGFQTAGQVARKYFAHETDVKNKIKLSYAGGNPVPWFFSNPPKPEKAIAVPDTEKMAIIKQLKETSMLSEVKKADGPPSNLTGYLNAPDRATMDREYSVVAARVAAIALRDDTAEFEQVVDQTVVSPGSQLSMLSKLCGQAAQREQWNQKAKYAEVGWPIIESMICGKVTVSQNMKTCLLGTVRAYFGQFGIAQAMEFLLDVKHDGSDEDKKAGPAGV